MKKIILSSLVFLCVACNKDVSPDYTTNFQGSYTQNYDEWGSNLYRTKGTYKFLITKSGENQVKMVASNTYVLTQGSEVIEQGTNSITIPDVKCTSETELTVNSIINSSGQNYIATGSGKLIGKNLKLELTSDDGKNTISQTFLLTKD
ncbi:hypothetical protein [Flectobacillus roseus]|uniref:Lipocalin-like domain-containing protein n=1 Tax=Flectobacillus roseus TaxID=502259 RepID=A0ABT6Y5U6_9BACT|nr:hypothetical protein [Flectobacillus roseus]MDI9858934.1 hypothetical protein [Flectobacillus roseus]